jgi:hypothetical protein
LQTVFEAVSRWENVKKRAILDRFRAKRPLFSLNFGPFQQAQPAGCALGSCGAGGKKAPENLVLSRRKALHAGPCFTLNITGTAFARKIAVQERHFHFHFCPPRLSRGT